MAFEHKKEINSFFGKHGFFIGFLFLTIIVIFVRLVLILPNANVPDMSWLLYATNEWLHGAKLYVDIVEINPPLIFFLYAVPVSIADFIGVGYFFTFNVFNYLILLLTTLYCYRVLLYSFKLERKVVQVLMLVLLLSLTLMAGEAFGQREFYFIIFALPYILLAGLRLQGLNVSAKHASLVGFVAFFGFALKPYFFFIPVGLEILLLIKYKQILKIFRMETFVLGGMVLAYIALIFFYTPEYLSHIYALAKEVYSNGYNRGLYELLSSSGLYLLMTFCLPFLVMWCGKDNRALISVLFVALIGCWLSYFTQSKGWFYHLYPALVMLYMLLTFLLIESKFFQKITLMRQDRLDSNGRLIVIFFFFTIIFSTYISVHRVVVTSLEGNYVSEQVGLYKSHYKEQTGQPLRSLSVFGFFMSQGFSAVTDHELKWGARFPSFWVLRGILKKRKRDILAGNFSKPSKNEKWAEDYSVKSVIEDIIKFKPDLIIVSQKKWWHQALGKEKLGLLDYFKQKEAFREIWADYKLDISVKDYDFYRRIQSQN